MSNTVTVYYDPQCSALGGPPHTGPKMPLEALSPMNVSGVGIVAYGNVYAVVDLGNGDVLATADKGAALLPWLAEFTAALDTMTDD